MSELVSIVVPVYKVELYVEQCIRSLQQQTYQNIQIIIVDDGSPDQSGLICEKIAESDRRIEVIHKTNEGVSTARNTGIEKASGKYICFVDSDDYVEADYIKKLVETIENTASELVVCGYSRKDGDKEIYKFPYPEGIMKKENWDFFKYLSCGVGACYPWNKIFRLDIIKSNNIIFPSGIHPGEDLIFCITYIQYINTVFFLKEYLYIYVNSISSVMNYNKERSIFDNYYRQIDPVQKLLNATDDEKFKICYKVRLYEISTSLVYDCKKFDLGNDLSEIKYIIRRYLGYYLKAPFVPLRIKVHYLLMGRTPYLFDYLRKLYRKYKCSDMHRFKMNRENKTV